MKRVVWYFMHNDGLRTEECCTTSAKESVNCKLMAPFGHQPLTILGVDPRM